MTASLCAWLACSVLPITGDTFNQHQDCTGAAAPVSALLHAWAKTLITTLSHHHARHRKKAA
jgi:hypothetical protein